MMATMRAYLFFSLLIALLPSGLRTVLADDGTDMCTLCADGTIPDGDFEPSNPMVCEILSENLDMTGAEQKACNDARLVGYKMCGCPTFPDIFCNMCDYGLSDDGYYQDLAPRSLHNVIIPGAPLKKTCKEAEFPLANETAFCSYIQTAAWFCGCPNAERAADSYLCTDQSEPANGDSILPPDFEFTCATLNRAGGIGDFEFETVVQEIPLDVQGYCGCTDDAVPPATCSLCGEDPVLNGNYILDAAGGMTCDELNVTTSWINVENACVSLQDEFGALCCMELVPTPKPAAVPTLMPVSAPAAAPTPTVQPVVSPTVPAPTTSSAFDVSSSSSVFRILIVPSVMAFFIIS